MESKNNCRIRPEKLIWPLLALLLLERLALFAQLGPEYMSNSDDMAYVQSGIYFARTGVISMWGEHPSAMIMPGMPLVIGFFALFLREQILLQLVLKLVWIGMGVLTAWFTYRIVAMLLNPWGGLMAAAGFLIPNMAWMNHLILTETPFLLFLSMFLYFGFRLERRGDARSFAGLLLSFLGALLFRGNILPYALFFALWLWIREKRNRALLGKRTLIFLAVTGLLLGAWGLRNQQLFGRFLPLGYGAGNPLLLGTYQGQGYPADEELDYETNVTAVMRRDYASYYKEPEPWDESEVDYYIAHFDPRGEAADLDQAQYLSLTEDGVKARYRLAEWWKRDPGSLLKSYLLIKPRWMLNWAWSWEAPFGIAPETFHRISQIQFVLCLLAGAAVLIKKRCRGPLLFLTALYFANVYIYATAFVTDRYASTLMILRFLIVGIGFGSLFPAKEESAERKE